MKKIWIVRYKKNGTNYEAKFNGDLTWGSVEQRLIMERHVGRGDIITAYRQSVIAV